MDYNRRKEYDAFEMSDFQFCLGGSMSETKFQAHLKRRLSELLPGCLVLKNDANSLQGIPDLLILFRDRWAILEVKDSKNAPFRPNQEYYLAMLDEMSIARVIYPENEEEVLHEILSTLRPCG